MRSTWWFGPWALGGTLLMAGCGETPPEVDTSDVEAKVTGTVKIEGKPATKGEVTFNPANYKRVVGPRVVPIKPDGTYEATTLTGENIVTVGGPEVPRDPNKNPSRAFAVKAGANELNIEVPPPK